MWAIYSLLSAIFSAACALLEKRALFALKPFDFSLALYLLLSAVFTAAFFLFGGSIGYIDPLSVLFIYTKSLTNVVSFLFIMHGIKHAELSRGLPLLLLAPAFVAVSAYIIFGDTMTAKQIFGIALITAGGYALAKTKISGAGGGDLRAYLFFFSALVVLTGSALLNRHLLVAKNVKPLDFAFLEHVFAAFNFLAVSVVARRKFSGALNAVKVFPVIISAVAVSTALYRFFEVAAMADANPALVTALKRLSVVIAVIIGGRLFNEQDKTARITASLLMFAGAVLIVL